jgi:hypothetical protein
MRARICLYGPVISRTRRAISWSITSLSLSHILKQTGSYELADFALQDTTQAVMRHYSQFAASEKTTVATDIPIQI